VTRVRIAIVSDIHGNLTALEVVIADLLDQSPDAIYHLGDLVTHGCRPAEVVDRIRDIGWKGVLGNTDEMLWRPELFANLAAAAPKLRPLYEALFQDLAPATRDLLGPDRIAWLQTLPPTMDDSELTMLHASPGNLWRAPLPDAPGQEVSAAYQVLNGRIVVYGHIHRPYIRCVENRIVANTGSVGLSYDGDARASYLLITDGRCEIRRVPYDVEQETRALLASTYPRRDWLAGMLRTARYAPAT